MQIKQIPIAGIFSRYPPGMDAFVFAIAIIHFYIDVLEGQLIFSRRFGNDTFRSENKMRLSCPNVSRCQGIDGQYKDCCPEKEFPICSFFSHRRPVPSAIQFLFRNFQPLIISYALKLDIQAVGRSGLAMNNICMQNYKRYVVFDPMLHKQHGEE